MRLGFTGTREGMSAAQRRQLLDLLVGWCGRVREFHHGGAKGADLEADWEARKVLGIATTIHHPAGHDAGSLLRRNREIVAACDVLIAAPLQDAEQVRSGTWATVRYARQAAKPVVMLSRGGK